MPPTTLTAPLGIGDKVYTLVRRDATVTIQCPYCGTAGTITFNAVDGTATTVKCPKCDGAGKLRASKSRTVYDVKRREIVGVTILTGTTSFRMHDDLVTYHFGGEAGGSVHVKGDAASLGNTAPGAYIDTAAIYWLNKADAEAVSARISDPGVP